MPVIKQTDFLVIFSDKSQTINKIIRIPFEMHPNNCLIFQIEAISYNLALSLW